MVQEKRLFETGTQNEDAFHPLLDLKDIITKHCGWACTSEVAVPLAFDKE